MNQLVFEIMKIAADFKSRKIIKSMNEFSADYCGTNWTHFSVMKRQDCVSLNTALRLANTLKDRGYTEEAGRLLRRVMAEADIPRAPRGRAVCEERVSA